MSDFNDEDRFLADRRFDAERHHLTEDELMKQTKAGVLIPDFLPSRGLALAFGPPKQGGKTFFWLRVLRRISQGLPLFGHQTGLPRRVTFVATEGWDSLPGRCAALASIDGPAPLFRAVTHPIDIFNSDDVSQLLRATDADHVTGWDCLSGLMVGQDENGPAMSRTMTRLMCIGRETGALQVIIHHNSYAAPDRPRGHSSQTGMVDAIIRHEILTDATKTATLAEARDMPPGRRLRYRIQPIDAAAVAEEVHETPAPKAKAGK